MGGGRGVADQAAPGAPAVPGDHLGPAADHHLVDIAPDQYLAVAAGHGYGVSRCRGSATATANSPVRDACRRHRMEPGVADGELDEGDRVPLPEGYKAPASMGEPMGVSAGNSAETGSQRTASTTIPFRPETAPFHGGVKLAEFRGFLGVYERISGNGDAPFGALAPILRIRLCGPICTTKPSAQSLLFLCAREPGQQRCPRSRDPFAAGRRSDLPGKKCGLQWASCSTHYNNQNGLYFRVGE